MNLLWNHFAAMWPALTLAQAKPAFNWTYFVLVFPVVFVLVFAVMMIMGKKKN